MPRTNGRTPTPVLLNNKNLSVLPAVIPVSVQPRRLSDGLNECAWHDQRRVVGVTGDDPGSFPLHSFFMLPVARGLPFSLRAGLKPSIRLTPPPPRPPLITKPLPTLNAFRQFSSTRFRNARYIPFEVDPEQPFNYRRWNTATQVGGGILVLSIAYYVVQYVPTFAQPGDHHSHGCTRSLETVPETGRWRFMDVSPKFETKVCLEQGKTRNSAPDNHRPFRWRRSLTNNSSRSSKARSSRQTTP